MKKPFSRIIAFGFVGSMAAVVNLLVVWLLVDYIWHLTPLKANIVGFLVAFWVSYWGHSKLTFNDTGHSIKHAAPRFFIVATCSFAYSESMYWLLLEFTPAWYLLALFFVLVTAAIFTFVMSKIWAFTSNDSK